MCSLKKCSKCEIEKELSEFSKQSKNPDGMEYHCKLCLREKRKQRALDNPGKMAEYIRKSRQKHLEKRRKEDRNYSRQNRQKKTDNYKNWRHNNPEKVKAANKKHYQYQRKWLKSHSELTAYHAAARRALAKKATPPWVDKEHKDKIKEIYKSARVSSEFHEIPFHVDHIEPLKGINENREHVSCGLNVWWNLQSIPASENMKKSNKLIN